MKNKKEKKYKKKTRSNVTNLIIALLQSIFFLVDFMMIILLQDSQQNSFAISFSIKNKSKMQIQISTILYIIKNNRKKNETDD